MKNLDYFEYADKRARTEIKLQQNHGGMYKMEMIVFCSNEADIRELFKAIVDNLKEEIDTETNTSIPDKPNS